MKHRNRALAWLLAVCFLIGLTGAAFAADPARTYVPGDYVQNNTMWIRSAPQTESAQLGKLPKNSVVHIQEILNESWGWVSYNGVSGWVSLLYSDLLDTEITVASLPQTAVEADFDAMKSAGISGVLLCAGYSVSADPLQPLRLNEQFAALYGAARDAGLAVGAYFAGPTATEEAASAAGVFLLELLDGMDVSLWLPVFLRLDEAPAGTQLPAVATAFAAALQNTGFHPGVYCTSAQAEAFPALSDAENGVLWVADHTAADRPLEAAMLWEYRGETPAAEYALSRCYYDYPNRFSRPCPKDAHVPGEDWITLTPATCSQTGLAARRCTVCRTFVEERAIDMIEHMPAPEPAVAPGCTAPGVAEGMRCSVCGAVLEGCEKLPAAGHQWVLSEQMDPTSGGITRVCTCRSCGLALPTIALLRVGDVTFDGAVTAEDARLILRAAVGLEDYLADGVEFAVADADADNEVLSGDARMALRAAVGLETPGYVRVELPDVRVLERTGAQQPEEPVSEPTDEPASEPTDEPASEPMDEPASEPMDEPASEPMDEPASEPMDEPVSEPMDEPVDEKTPLAPGTRILTVSDKTGAPLQLAVLDTIQYSVYRCVVLAETDGESLLNDALFVAAVTEDPDTHATVLNDVPEDVAEALLSLYAQRRAASETARKIAAFAEEQVGKPFALDAAGPDSFDNSGFVYYCFTRNGVALPRRTSQIAEAGARVAREELLPGDIVVFCNELGGEAELVGIYLGGNRFVSCNSTESPTGILDLNREHWSTHFLYGIRAV